MAEEQFLNIQKELERLYEWTHPDEPLPVDIDGDGCLEGESRESLVRVLAERNQLVKRLAKTEEQRDRLRAALDRVNASLHSDDFEAMEVTAVLHGYQYTEEVLSQADYLAAIHPETPVKGT